MFRHQLDAHVHFQHTGVSCSILIVEDEPEFRSQLGQALTLIGHRVAFAESGEKALARLIAAPCDALLLSLETPGLDGLTVLANARHLCPDLTIIVLTACPARENALAAMRCSAADYLCKPVRVGDAIAAIGRALSARDWHSRERLMLRALARAAETLFPESSPAPTTDSSDSVIAGPLVLSLDERRIRSRSCPDDAHLELTENETGLMACLMAQPGEAVSCETIVRRLTGQELDAWEATSIVRPMIFRLRQKLSSNPHFTCSIRTVRGAGYRLLLG